jgi:benzodiazapine receptor
MSLALSARPHALKSALLALAVVFSAALIGNIATFPNIPGWYAGLEKPGFTPPNWLFGPVWTMLYIIMAFAFWRILEAPSRSPGKSTAVTWFLIQMALNAAWSVAFFGLHSPGLGLIVIGGMILAIVMTMLSFARLDRLAALILLPYLAWVCFASALNAAIFILNR